MTLNQTSAELAYRMMQQERVGSGLPVAVAYGLAIARQTVRQHQQNTEYMFHNGFGAVVANIGDGNPMLARRLEIDIVRARCGQADVLQLGSAFQQRFAQLDLVRKNDIGIKNAFFDLVFTGNIVDREIGSDILNGAEVEPASHGVVVQEHSFHDAER